MIECEVPFVGMERIQSIAAMFGVLAALDIDLVQAAEHIEKLELPPGRGNLVEVGGITIINDSYNANPISMKMSLRHLAGMQSSHRRIALLGEMLELGTASRSAHQEIGQHLAGIEEVYTVGPGFSSSSFARKDHFQTIGEFDAEAFVAQLQPGDCILIKGSNKVFWKQDFVNRLSGLIRLRT